MTGEVNITATTLNVDATNGYLSIYGYDAYAFASADTSGAAQATLDQGVNLSAATINLTASSTITGTVAAIAADMVARGGPAGVLPPEAAFDPRAFLTILAERGLTVAEREFAR